MPEREYGFGQGEGVVTVVQRTPVGVEVTEGKKSDPEVEAAMETADIPGVEVEVIATDPAAAHPLSGVSRDAKASTTKKKVASGPSAAFGPVGPDPAQEATKRVSVKSPTGPQAPAAARRESRESSPTGATGPTASAAAKSVTGATGPKSTRR